MRIIDYPNGSYIITNCYNTKKKCDTVYYNTYYTFDIHSNGFYTNNKKLNKFIIQNKMHNIFVNNIKQFKYAHKKGCYFYPTIFEIVIEYDNPKVLKYICRHRYGCPSNFNNVIDRLNESLTIYATKYGSTKCLKYFCRNSNITSRTFLYDIETLYDLLYRKSINNNNLKCLKVLHRNRLKYNKTELLALSNNKEINNYIINNM